MIYIIVASFMDPVTLQNKGITFDFNKWTLTAYERVISNSQIWVGFKNAVIYSIVFTFVSVAVTLLAAYPMSRVDFKGRGFFNVIFVITMFFGGGLIPYFMLIVNIGLYDSFLVYVIPALYSVYNMIVLTGFFRSIDPAIRESAMMDGANEFRIWWSLYLPVSTPALATVGLWLAVARWNSYMPTLVYTRKDESMWLLQYYLMRIIRDASLPDADPSVSQEISSRTISFAAIVVATVPIFCVYPFVAKYFTKGVMLGAIKG